MKSTQDEFEFRTIWSDQDGEYVGLCDRFPSLSWLAKTREEALQGIRDLVQEILVDLEIEEPPDDVRG